MKNKIFKISIILLIIMLSTQNIYAITLTIKSNKEEINIGDMVEITVSWDKGMQAADYSLIYDSKKLEYIESDIEDDFTNNLEGEVKTSWASFDDKDKFDITYTFKAIKGGKAKFETKINGGFSTGELEIQKDYENAESEIRIKSSSLYKFVLIFVIILILFIIICIKKKGEKNVKNK